MAASHGHPRLYFDSQELARLRTLRREGVHARIWNNLAESAEWCLSRPIRTSWIAPVADDPIYLNLYDRFYAMMHDMAVAEHLAFAYAYSGETRYQEGARMWALACARVWRREADGEPDASKAYAVMRVLKGIAVAYDILHNDLSPAEQSEMREILRNVGGKYYQWYLDNPGMAGPEQNKHHGSVEATSFGVAALACLEEVPEAEGWLDLIVKKHTDYLLPHALEPSGTQEQSSNFWASTMHYRLFFMDALRRVTGRDLFKQYESVMTGRIALAAVAGPTRPDGGDTHQSVLFGPCYGQLDYWSPVLLYLAREYRRPVYQHLALWDGQVGSIPKTRYVTPNGEQLLFEFGGYCYAWYDPTVPARVEADLPVSFDFFDVNEAYARSSYDTGAIVAAVRRGLVAIHAGGRLVVADESGFFPEPKPVNNLALSDDGRTATIRCRGVEDSRFSEQTVTLERPARLTVRRRTGADTAFWCHDMPERNGNVLTWADGTAVRVTKGVIVSFDPEGHRDEMIVGMGKLKCPDPMPRTHPLFTARPHDGELTIEVRTP